MRAGNLLRHAQARGFRRIVIQHEAAFEELRGARHRGQAPGHETRRAGFRGGDNEAIYTGTKHAQVGFAGALDRELRVKGVRVALVCPAGVETEFALGFGRTAGEEKLKTYLRPEDVAFQITTIMSQPRSVRTHVWKMWSMGQDS